mgnify:CR=1 FL=1
MSTPYLPQTWLGLGLQIPAFLYVLIGLYAYRRYRLQARIPFAWMMVSMAFWSASYGLEVAAQNITEKVWLAKVEYLGIVSLPVFWLRFVLAFLGHANLPGRRTYRLLWGVPILTLLLVWTNELHWMVWSGYTLGEAPFFLLILEHGEYFWIHTLYSYAAILGGVIILLTAAIQMADIHRAQTLTLLFGILVPTLANLSYLGQAIPIKGLDLTPFFFLVTGIAILTALQRYHLLEVIPLPFGNVVEGLNEAVIVVNHNHGLVYMNPTAERLTGKAHRLYLGKPLSEVCRFAGALQNRLPARAKETLEIPLDVGDGLLHTFEVTLQPFDAAAQQSDSTLILLRDITDAYQARLSIERRDAILQALSQASIELMRSAKWENVLPAVLEQIGQAADVSRVYLFENVVPEMENKLYVRQRFEWCAPHASPQIDNPVLQKFAIVESGFARWVDLLSRRQLVVGNIANFPKEEQEVLASQEIYSILVMPIFVEERWWGFIGFDECRSERLWHEPEVESLRLVAELLGASIQRSEMQAEMEQRQHMLDVIHEVVLLALQSSSLEGMAQTLVDRLGMFIGAEHCFFTLWDEQKKQVIPFAAYGKYRETYRQMQPASYQPTLTASALRLGHALVVEDTHHTPYLAPEIAAQFETNSVLVLPLIAGGKRLGAILIGFSRYHRFTIQEISAGERAAALVSLILLKFHTLSQLEQRARESEVLREAGAAVIATLHPEEVIERILDELQKVVPYDSASVQLLKNGELEIVGGRGWRDVSQVLGIHIPLDDEHPNTVVMQTLKPLRVSDTSIYTPFQKTPHHNIRSWLGVPLVVQDRSIGLLTMDSTQKDFFTPEHEQLVAAFANQVALALENARIFEKAQSEALTDALTGLYNRRGLMELGRFALARAVQAGGSLVAIMMDIDHFKRVNDTYGHLIGDQVLQVIARRCEKSARDIDIVGRYGGEEFLFLLPEVTERFAFNIADRLRLLISETAIPTSAGPLPVTVSLGVSEYRQQDTRLEELIDRADCALYSAKQKGRNCVVIFKESPRLRLVHKRSRERRMA